ncbi:MAG: hypothetical protein U1F37_09320 [Alphaproteobacteria bacterium]
MLRFAMTLAACPGGGSAAAQKGFGWINREVPKRGEFACRP